MKDYQNPGFLKLPKKKEKNLESIWEHSLLTQAYFNMLLIDQIVSLIGKQLQAKFAMAYYPLKT